MNIVKEAAAKLAIIREINAERENEHKCNLLNVHHVYDELLGWDEYNYGGVWREYHAEVAKEIVHQAMAA